jgi:hypothetical protein
VAAADWRTATAAVGFASHALKALQRATPVGVPQALALPQPLPLPLAAAPVDA